MQNNVRVAVLATLLLLGVSTAAAQAQQCFPAPHGLVAWWPAEASADDIENGHHGAMFNGAAFQPGIVGHAFSFDGFDDFMGTPNATSLNEFSEFTVEAWVFPTVLDIKRAVVDHGMSCYSPRSWDLAIGGTAFLHKHLFLDFSLDGVGAGIIGSTGTVELNQWTHVAMVFEQGQVTFYINGLPSGGGNIGGNLFPNSSDFRIGGFHCPPTNPDSKHFPGLIDEVAFYNRALNASEIQAISDAYGAGKCKDEDGDGFRPPDDCDETNPDINPDALEISFNFIDENCDGNLGDCDPCAAWPNHGAYVRCVSDAVSNCSTNDFTPEEADAFVSSAIRSDIGKPGFVPPQCQ